MFTSEKIWTFLKFNRKKGTDNPSPFFVYLTSDGCGAFMIKNVASEALLFFLASDFLPLAFCLFKQPYHVLSEQFHRAYSFFIV